MDLYRKLMAEILEAKSEKKTKTKTKDTDDTEELPKVDDRKSNVSTSPSGSKADKSKPEEKPLPGKTRSRDQSRNLRVDPQLSDFSITVNQEFPDDGEEDNIDVNAPVGIPDAPPPPDNLPVPLNRLPALIRDGQGQTVNITFDDVKNLPNYNKITRGLTREYFRDSIQLEPKDVKVASTLSGTSQSDMRALFNYIANNGVCIDSFDHGLPDVAQLPRGYSANYPSVRVYHCDGHAWILMREELSGPGVEMTNFYAYVAMGKGTQTQQRVGGHAAPKLGAPK